MGCQRKKFQNKEDFKLEHSHEFQHVHVLYFEQILLIFPVLCSKYCQQIFRSISNKRPCHLAFPLNSHSIFVTTEYNVKLLISLEIHSLVTILNPKIIELGQPVLDPPCLSRAIPILHSYSPIHFLSLKKKS